MGPETARELIAVSRDENVSSGRRERAVAAVVAGFLPLARTLARRYGNRGIDREDLEQVAALALMKAIGRYDLSAPTPFGAYATPTITGELRRYFRDHGWMVRPPRHLQEKRQQLVQIKEELRRRRAREPEPDELAAALEVDGRQLRQLEVVNQNLSPASLDASRPDGSSTLGDLVRSDATQGEGDLDEQIAVRSAVDSLPALERRFIYLRYTRGLVQHEIADRLGVNAMTVSRLQRRTLMTLKTKLADLAPVVRRGA